MKKYSKYLLIFLIPIVVLTVLCFIPIRVSSLIPVIEKQISEDIGAKVRIEKLILRVGPFLKVKTPIMHIMYSDGEKFAQFDNVKFYIPWHTLIQKNPKVNSIYANKLTVRLKSDDSLLEELLNKNQQRDFKNTPNVTLKQYKLTYYNKKENDKYIFEGQDLLLKKIRNYKNYKFKTNGSLSIDNVKYITYDLSILPEYNLPEQFLGTDFTKFLERVKELDFHSDLIADLKIYKNQFDVYQASGFVNVDNISVLDYSKKTPKSFVYLTLWGDKASLLSNIYTSQTQKIFVEGMINNSKKPIIDIKVKTDEIKLTDLYKKLRILFDFSALKSIDTLDGKLSANFSLKGDLNKIKSNGYLNIIDASLKADNLIIDKINSNIDFTNNVININNTVGYVKNSPIVIKGYIDKTINIELLMSKVELKHLLPSSLGVQSGLASLSAKFNGTIDNITHKENLLIDNLKLSNKYLDLAIETAKIDTNKNNTAYINNVLCNTTDFESIKIPSLNLIIGDDYLKIPKTNIFMPNSQITVNSEICNYNNKDISFNLLAEGFVNSKDMKKFSEHSFRYPLKITFNGNKNNQNLLSQVVIENTAVFEEPTILNLNAKIDKKNIKLEDFSVYSFTGKFDDDAKIKGQKKIAISGMVENIQKPVLKNIRIFIPQLLNLHIFDSFMQIKGDLFVNGEFDKLETIGQLTLNSLVNQPLQLNLTNTTFDFNKNNVQINSPLIKIGDSTLSLTGNLDNIFSDSLNFNTINIKSKFLNLDTLLMYKDSPLLNKIPLCIKDGKIYAEKVSSNIYGNYLYLSGFSSEIRLNNSILTLKNLLSEMYNGKLAGNIKFNMRDEHFDANLMARGVSAEPVFKLISNKKESISGTMDFDALLQGELTSKQSLLGNIKFVVNNGRMASLGKLEHLLYAQNVIADNMLRTSLSVVTKAITLKDTGLFKYLRGDVDLKNGIVQVKMIQSQGPLMSLFIKGDYNPLNNHGALTVLGRLSDEVISGLGAFGEFSFNKLLIMLTGEEMKENILPEDFDKIPQLPMKNTKEFRSIINGNIDKPASVLLFNWISYSQKSLKQKEIPMNEVKLPGFIEDLPY